MLPANIYFSRVSGKLFDQNFGPINEAPVIQTGFDLDTEVQMPLYLAKQAYDITDVDSTTMLLIKVYAIDKADLRMKYVGFTAINLYLDEATGLQPEVEMAADFKLNQGAFQLPIFTGKIDLADQFTMSRMHKYKRFVIAH
jgi:hypothetical protein